MSVIRHNANQYKLTCDGSRCSNYYILDDTREAIKEADDWLQRHGWRSIEGRTHWCRFCVNKMDVFVGEKVDELEQRYRAGLNKQYHRI